MVEDGIGSRCEASVRPVSEVIQLCVDFIYLILQGGDVILHLLELGRVFESIGAAVGSVHAVETEVAASMTWCLAIALDFPPFALIASY